MLSQADFLLPFDALLRREAEAWDRDGLSLLYNNPFLFDVEVNEFIMGDLQLVIGSIVIIWLTMLAHTGSWFLSIAGLLQILVTWLFIVWALGF